MSSKNPDTVLTVKVGSSPETAVAMTATRKALDWATRKLSEAAGGRAVFVWTRRRLMAAYAAGRVIAKTGGAR